MKNLLFIFLLAGFKLLAQNVAADSIYLSAPNTKAPKVKTATVKTKGEELASHGFSAIAAHVSLIKDIPKGELQTLTFYFNSGLINLNKKEFNVEYKDTTLALVIYEVGHDGKPGKAITDGALYFTVTKEHRGALELDLSTLNLPTQLQLFIGMAATDDHTTEQVVLKVRENKNARSFSKSKGSDVWTEYTDGSDFKFDIKMKVEVKVGE
ncbi:MAG: hypothetical protein V4581_12015 [Bacteroidota bacterium]